MVTHALLVLRSFFIVYHPINAKFVDKHSEISSPKGAMNGCRLLVLISFFQHYGLIKILNDLIQVILYLCVLSSDVG